MASPGSKSTPRKNRTIVVPFDQDRYPRLILRPEEFRAALDNFTRLYPELFPPEIRSGYHLKEIYHSKKLRIPTRRITVKGVHYTVRPAFVMPYQAGMVDEVEKPLFLRKFDVPFWALVYLFGKDPMYWYRLEQSLGRNSVVGATVNHAQSLPE